MTRERRRELRYSVLLCAHGLRNLAYFRAGKQAGPAVLNGDFMVSVNNNFLDVCVLEWCKLFGDKKAKHCWSKIVDDQKKYEAALLTDLGMDRAQFAAYVDEMREYRDKFIAHLDEEATMHIPSLDATKASLAFHMSYLAGTGGSGAVLAGLPLEPYDYFEHCRQEAEGVYIRLKAALPECAEGKLQRVGRNAGR